MLTKIGVGMSFTVFSFLAAAGLQYLMDVAAENDERITIWGQVPMMILLAIAEVMVFVTGFDFAYSQSPRNMKSLIISLFLVCNAVGNLIGGALFTALSDEADDDSEDDSGVLSRTVIFLVLAGAMFVDLLVFVYVKSRYQYVSFEKQKSVS